MRSKNNKSYINKKKTSGGHPMIDSTIRDYELFRLIYKGITPHHTAVKMLGTIDILTYNTLYPGSTILLICY